jgi:hypothetical protein
MSEFSTQEAESVSKMDDNERAGYWYGRLLMAFAGGYESVRGVLFRVYDCGFQAGYAAATKKPAGRR